jgi:hypothetical protein
LHFHDTQQVPYSEIGGFQSQDSFARDPRLIESTLVVQGECLLEARVRP